MDAPHYTAVTPPAPNICLHHPGVMAHRVCDRCRLPYCEDCLVTIGGQTLCGGCKAQALREARRRGGNGIAEANRAFLMSILGLFICQPVYAPLALARSVGLLRRFRETPGWPGKSKAYTAAWIAGVSLALLVVQILSLISLAFFRS